MATLTIRDVDPKVRDGLRAIAAANGRSMEAELRALVAEHVALHSRRPSILEAAERFRGETGGVDLWVPSRDELADPPTL